MKVKRTSIRRGIGVAYLILFFGASLYFIGLAMPWSKVEPRPVEDASIVFRYISEPLDGPASFAAGPYLGGTAVIDLRNDRAFWVHENEAYTVNQAAMDVASTLKQAPENVKYDDIFIEAVGPHAAILGEDLEDAMKELAEANSKVLRFYALNDAAKECFVAGRIEDARSYAEELLTLVPWFRWDWNYGNAVQDANLVLGRIAVREGRIDDAKMYLTQSGNTPGSPQLDTFGPNMSLAKDLLEKGQPEIVIEYFELCRKFWEMHDGQLDKWSQQVRDGGIPDFGANLCY